MNSVLQRARVCWILESLDLRWRGPGFDLCLFLVRVSMKVVVGNFLVKQQSPAPNLLTTKDRGYTAFVQLQLLEVGSDLFANAGYGILVVRLLPVRLIRLSARGLSPSEITPLSPMG
ncbi:hypothetical protein EOA86_00575 [Mesorhizobium sp. M5C.F.Ca.IN.020.32.2.1]|nr:hypothetical protein EOA86_00575 [Mesorhizobium sp. M5C.F.Ca.IN.020.32.2.1]